MWEEGDRVKGDIQGSSVVREWVAEPWHWAEEEAKVSGTAEEDSTAICGRHRGALRPSAERSQLYGRTI